MEEGSRRDFLKAALSGLTSFVLLPGESEAAGLEQLDLDKAAAADRMLAKVTLPENRDVLTHISAKKYWGDSSPGSYSTSELRAKLIQEAEIQLPTSTDISVLQKKYSDILGDLARKIRPGKQGIFIDGDSQTLFLLHKNEKSQLHVIKKYPIATSFEDFSNEQDSRGTPAGWLSVQGKKEGLLGEVISTLNKHADETKYFTNYPVTELDRTGNKRVHVGTFTNGLTLDTQRVPEVITAGILLDGKRGIWIHGTPRMGLINIPYDQRRQKAGSTGCIRISNLGAIDLLKYVDINTSVYIYGKNPPRPKGLDWFTVKKK